MIEKLQLLRPEIVLLIGAMIILFMGLFKKAAIRKLCPWTAILTLLIAGGAVATDPSAVGEFTSFVKLLVVVVGVLLVAVGVGVPSELQLTGAIEDGHSNEPFDPGTVIRGEYFAFMLLSLTGVMLCAGANDLIWLFLSLELVSLPTYVMIAITKDKSEAQESSVKYFFLGALSAAIFLYGFALLYGAAGTTILWAPDNSLSIAGQALASIQANGELSPLFKLGFTISIIGIFFKIAAFPMHFYVADVYQGAATSVTAFLAVVPKIAGFVALILLLNTMYWPIPPYMTNLILIFAAVTMIFGNTLALLQTNVKRMLAYSSVAHSGYMLVGLVCVTGAPQASSMGNGVAAVLFYLLSYGLANVAVFGVLSCIKINGQEAQTLDDIAGFARSHRRLGAVMAIGIFSLIGLPPLAMFFGKVYIFGSALEMGYTWIFVVAVINTAVSAAYYLRILSAAYASNTNPATQMAIRRTRQTAAFLAAAGCILLGVAGNKVAEMAKGASGVDRFRKSTTENTQFHGRPTTTLPEDLDYTVEQPKAKAKPKAKPVTKPDPASATATEPVVEPIVAQPSDPVAKPTTAPAAETVTE